MPTTTLSMFETKRVPFSTLQQFARTDVAYTLKDPVLRPFYEDEASLEGLINASRRREKFPVDRKLLVDEIERQYSGLQISGKLAENIAALSDERTLTITTAHQPILAGGPLYVIFKALNAIRLSNALNAQNPGNRYVPVFVIGGEDHDFEEVNHCRIYGKDVVWDTPSGGPVGRLSSDTLEEAVESIARILGQADHAPELISMLRAAYSPGKTYNRSTLEWMHALLGHYGLVVFHMDNAACKNAFMPAMEAELTGQSSFGLVGAVQKQLESLGFKPQAHVREINLFLIDDFTRNRIVQEGDDFFIYGSSERFSRKEMLNLLRSKPERFSPNVVMRPLMQETILPNIAYVGGGGEIAYWLERKSQFEAFGVFYPVLLRRNSMALLERSTAERLNKYGFELEDTVKGADAMIKEYLQREAGEESSLDPEKEELEQIYERIAEKSRLLDPTLEKPVVAELTRTLQGIGNLEQKMLRAGKQKHEVALNQIRGAMQKIFPDGNLQERIENFMPWYVKYGPAIFDEILAAADPLNSDFIFLQAD